MPLGELEPGWKKRAEDIREIYEFREVLGTWVAVASGRRRGRCWCCCFIQSRFRGCVSLRWLFFLSYRKKEFQDIVPWFIPGSLYPLYLFKSRILLLLTLLLAEEQCGPRASAVNLLLLIRDTHASYLASKCVHIIYQKEPVHLTEKWYLRKINPSLIARSHCRQFVCECLFMSFAISGLLICSCSSVSSCKLSGKGINKNLSLCRCRQINWLDTCCRKGLKVKGWMHMCKSLP